MAIRFPFCTGGLDGKAQKTQPLENGLPHQCAHWFAMTVVVGTLAGPTYSAVNDHLQLGHLPLARDDIVLFAFLYCAFCIFFPPIAFLSGP